MEVVSTTEVVSTGVMTPTAVCCTKESQLPRAGQPELRKMPLYVNSTQKVQGSFVNKLAQRQVFKLKTENKAKQQMFLSKIFFDNSQLSWNSVHEMPSFCTSG